MFKVLSIVSWIIFQLYSLRVLCIFKLYIEYVNDKTLFTFLYSWVPPFVFYFYYIHLIVIKLNFPITLKSMSTFSMINSAKRCRLELSLMYENWIRNFMVKDLIWTKVKCARNITKVCKHMFNWNEAETNLIPRQLFSFMFHFKLEFTHVQCYSKRSYWKGCIDNVVIYSRLE